jgi:hypothetical protein
MATLPNGQINPGMPALHPGFVQTVDGGILKAAATSTLAQQAANVQAVKGLGAGQKGGRRTFRRRRSLKGGGANVVPLQIPSAGSIPGVDSTKNQIAGVDALNHLRVGAMYDKLANAPPYKVGGFRIREEDGDTGGRRKHRRKTKKHGRRHSRNHRRSRRKSSHRNGRNSRRV